MNSKPQGAIKRPKWLVVIYPDSAPKNWREKLQTAQIAYIASPLHDMDGGKPHYHLILCYSSNKTESQVTSDISDLHAPAPVVCKDFSMSVRYLIHADNPDKTQYNREDIEIFGNISIDKYFQTAPADSTVTAIAIIAHCNRNGICYFCDLIDSLIANNPALLQALKGDTKSLVKDYLYTKLLKNRHTKQDEREKRQDFQHFAQTTAQTIAETIAENAKPKNALQNLLDFFRRRKNLKIVRK